VDLGNAQVMTHIPMTSILVDPKVSMGCNKIITWYIVQMPITTLGNSLVYTCTSFSSICITLCATKEESRGQFEQALIVVVVRRQADEHEISLSSFSQDRVLSDNRQVALYKLCEIFVA
jgi:hypothetical protein